MMEDGAVSEDPGHTSTLMGALDTPDVSSATSSPPSSLLSPRSPPSSLPPARPGRPRPPQLSKASPPPLVSLSNPVSSSGLPQNDLPPPLSPTLVSSPPLLAPKPAASADQASPSPPFPDVATSSSSSSSSTSSSSCAAQLLTPVDRLVGSSSVWQPKGLSDDQITALLEGATAGTFLIHSKEDKSLTLSVRLSAEDEGTPRVHSLLIKQHKAYVHLDGSSLLFDDVFKLVSFYCVSRDILTIPLRLPQAITTATKREELEAISALGADFWTCDAHQQGDNQDKSKLCLYVNAVSLEEGSSPHPNQPNQPPISTRPTSTQQNVPSELQNGEASPNLSLEVKEAKKSGTNQDLKYKRPPPRPPSVAAGSGMGLLFASAPPTPSSTPSSAAKRKEEVKGSSGAEEERKPASPAPWRPPVPLHSRGAPPLPPAPLCRISSRKSSCRDAGDGRESEKGQNPAKKMEGTTEGENKTACQSGLPAEVGKGEANSPEKEVKKEKGAGEDEKREKETTSEEDGKEKAGSRCPPSVRKPSRPVPPPRRKPSDSPASSSQTTAAQQGAGTRAPAPARRPDVSLYSPQGGSVMGTEPESCSSSSTEEEGDGSQEQEQQNSHAADSRSTKVTVKRIPTTVMLDRARHRLSTVLTGLISHDRRLTQRIVELARDPLSYFGNLVKEHRTFTLETLANHSSSTELLQEIRQMVTQLKSYLLQSTELQAMLEPQHQYAQDKLENIVEAALCKSVLKPLREPIYQNLEKLHTDDGSLKQLTDNQSTVLGSTTTALGISTAVPEASAMEKISIKLNKLHLDYSPQRKIELLLKTCKIIYDSMSVSSPGRAHGADDFLPVMMYVLARSNLSNLQLDVEYMMELMDPSLALGEGSYYLTTTYGAVEHIKSFDQQRSATRQLSREVQDSIHRWERRRTLNQERVTQGAVRDFLTVCCPEIGSNPKTLGVLPSTTVHQLAEQCAARFEQDSYILSVFMDGVHRPLDPTELAVEVKSGLQPGAYCFVYHPREQPPLSQRSRGCPTDPPPAPPVQRFFPAEEPPVSTGQAEPEEESLISL